jgi:hypothetical protein
VKRRILAAALLLLAACGGARTSSVPGMPPVCDPKPWVDEDIPRLVAPFDAADDPAVEAAGLSAVPHLLNVEEVQRAMVEEFVGIMVKEDDVPPGTVKFWLLVDVDGGVDTVELDQGSGDDRIDGAARRVLRTLDLTPAVRGGCRVAVWVRYPFRLQIGGGGP